jgi:hypothetical protein
MPNLPRFQFTLATLFIVWTVLFVMMDFTLYVPALAWSIAAVLLGWLSITAVRRGKIIPAILCLLVIGYLAFLLFLVPWLERQRHF